MRLFSKLNLRGLGTWLVHRYRRCLNWALNPVCRRFLGILRIRLFGLSHRRLDEWFRVLDEESLNLDWGHLIREAWTVFRNPVTSARFRERVKVCHRCPIYDPELRRCRPYTGAPVGCGCYVPYKALSPGPCWVRQRRADMGWD